MNIYKSTPLKFIVEGETFYVHEDLLATHSEPLHHMLTKPGMKEAEQEYATLTDVTAPTFARFLEWMYKGFYSIPDPEIKQVEVAPASEKEDAIDAASDTSVRADADLHDFGEPPASSTLSVPWGSSRARRHVPKKKKRHREPSPSISYDRQQLKEKFIDTTYKEFRTSIPIAPIPAENLPDENYTEVFLCHARLYVFADKYLIDKLKTWALEALHETLKFFDLTFRRNGDLIVLLEYVYENTATPDRLWADATGNVWDGEPMRDMLTALMGWQMDVLIKDPEFGKLLVRDGGDLVDDFLSVVGKRI